jgi:hypothetical protein
VDKQKQRKRSGGRPPKFAEPSRPITLTLPERTLDELRQVDADPGRAIVKLAAWALQNNGKHEPLVEIVRSSDEVGIIVIGPCRALAQIPFLHLVEVGPARYLLALDFGHDFKSLEIAVRDIVEDLPLTDTRERHLLRELLERMKHLRKSDAICRAEILFTRSSA